MFIGDVLSFFDEGLKQATAALRTTVNPSSIKIFFVMMVCSGCRLIARCDGGDSSRRHGAIEALGERRVGIAEHNRTGRSRKSAERGPVR